MMLEEDIQLIDQVYEKLVQVQDALFHNLNLAKRAVRGTPAGAVFAGNGQDSPGYKMYTNAYDRLQDLKRTIEQYTA